MWISKIKKQQGLFLLTCFLPSLQTMPSHCASHHGKREQASPLVSLLIRALSHHGSPTLTTFLNLITFKDARLQMPSHWGLGLEHMDFGEDTDIQYIINILSSQFKGISELLVTLFLYGLYICQVFPHYFILFFCIPSEWFSQAFLPYH